MHARRFLHPLIAVLSAVAAFAAHLPAYADPPSRVARVAFVTGNASFSPAGESDWVQARLNRSLTTGDRLWTDRAARVELQIGGAVVRMGENSSLTLLNLDDNIAQFQLDQGTVTVRVRQLASGQSVEVATPNLAFTTRRPGSYRIGVDAGADTTDVVVRSGAGEVYGERASYAVDSRQSYRFAGDGLRSYEQIAAPRADDFERWGSERDRRAEASVSARYVSRDMIGYEDLDAYGTWRTEPGYGSVWMPSRVSSDWTPYHDGHWAWVDPWGWTWMDDAPWGFAVTHYGRWANLRGSWAWVPGPSRSRAVYAPALVAFVGGSDFQISISSGSVGGVAWFPLGPRDVYRPSYQVSRGYFDNVNRSNTTINNTTITNVYNNRNVTNVYVNQQVQGAVVAVPQTAFVQSQPVARASVRLPRNSAARAAVTPVAAVAPVEQSVRGGATAAAAPPAEARGRDHRVVVRQAPPAQREGFAARRQQLAANPGTPTQAPAAAPAAAAKPAPTNVVVAAPPQAAAPKALPPASAPEGKPSERRADRGDRGGKGDVAGKAAGPAPAAPQPSPPASRPASAPTPQQAAVPAAPPPAAKAPAAPPPVPQATAPVPAASSPAAKNGDRGGKRDPTAGLPPTAAGTVPAPAPAPQAPVAVAKPAPAAPPAPPPAASAPPKAAPAPQRDAKADVREQRREAKAAERPAIATAPPAPAAAPAPPPKPAPAPQAQAAPPKPAPAPAPAPAAKPAPPPAPAPAPPPAPKAAPPAPPAAPQAAPPKPAPPAAKDEGKGEKRRDEKGAKKEE